MFLVYPPQTHWHFKFGELLLALFLHTYLLTCSSLKDTKYFFVCAHVCLKYICYFTLPFSSNVFWKTVLGLHTYEARLVNEKVTLKISVVTTSAVYFLFMQMCDSEARVLHVVTQ